MKLIKKTKMKIFSFLRFIFNLFIKNLMAENKKYRRITILGNKTPTIQNFFKNFNLLKRKPLRPIKNDNNKILKSPFILGEFNLLSPITTPQTFLPRTLFLKDKI